MGLGLLVAVASLSVEHGARCVGVGGCHTWAHWLWCMNLAAPWHVGYPQTRAGVHAPCTGRRILNPCTTREVQICIVASDSLHVNFLQQQWKNNIGDQRKLHEGTSLLGHKGFEDTVVILNNLKYIVLKGLKGFTGSDFNFSAQP